MKLHLLLIAGFAGLALSAQAGLTAERVYLSGKGPADAVAWEFFCSAGRRSGEWTTIPVPSNWEQHGFGGYDYGHVPPNKKNSETGTYRTRFMAPPEWKDQLVRLVFEGAMTETTVKVNGVAVGAPNQGGYSPFRFLLGKDQLKYGQENELEVKVAKKPSNDSLDQAERKADFWVFGGIYRPVYLEILPVEFIHRVAIDARADGRFAMEVFPQIHNNMLRSKPSDIFVDEVVAQLQTRDGVAVGKPFSAPIRGGAGRVRLETKINDPALWSPEHPNLYQVRVSLQKKGKTVFEKTERFGFRTFELKPEDGLYLNGKKILIQGVNRNTFHPRTARAIDAETEWNDARAIKAMNANLVRSHLPPTTDFMQACDELGLLAILELCTWQKPSIDTPIARNLVCELVAMYQNHPAVILWANGNEGGFNLEVDELYHLLDLQDRPVLHPWAYHEALDTSHYPHYGALQDKLKDSRLYLPTEMLHGLYDGGHGAGLEDFWAAICSSKSGAGGVLWCWEDAAIERTDQNGKLDTDGNLSADGIVGPYGEKEASYYTVREIWSPVQIPLETLPAGFDGRLPVENRYYDTDLNQCSFGWRTMTAGSQNAIAQGVVKTPSIPPQAKGVLAIPLKAAGADVLELVAKDPHGTEIMRWSWALKPEADIAHIPAEPKLLKGEQWKVAVGKNEWRFDPKTGQLLSVLQNGAPTGFANGPVLHAANSKSALPFARTWTASANQTGSQVVIDANASDGSRFSWTFQPNGSVTLDYRFAEITDKLSYCAVGFDLDEGAVRSKTWLGDGPYRIWNNRRKGPQFGLWENSYNDGCAGSAWSLPEFKGVFGNVDWMRLNLASGAQLLVDTPRGSDLGVLRPANGNDPKNAIWAYPPTGGLFLFHQVPSVGTKFKSAEQLGPQGEPQQRSGPIQGQVVFSVESN